MCARSLFMACTQCWTGQTFFAICRNHRGCLELNQCCKAVFCRGQVSIRCGSLGYLHMVFV
jgi:hypothetical protein